MAPFHPQPNAGAWQFSLRELLALTTFAAIAAAFAAMLGMGIFVVAAGLSICYLNVRGLFARWQRGKWRWFWIGTACIAFALSLGLPAAAIPFRPAGGSVDYLDLRGWEAAQASFHMLFAWPFDSLTDLAGWAAYVLYACANVVLVLSPVWAWRLSRGRGDWYGTIAVVSAADVWCAAIWLRGREGYYLWALPMLILVTAWRIRSPALLAMVLTALLFIAIVAVGGIE
ncbi:MAG TPA: hypothetical protein VJ783_18655 [Pirellulales bacterium]|nr:hypothetical protein [Pirellulales bacterium]